MTKELDAPLKTAHGEDDPQFFHIGSALVVAAALPLAFGIAADIAVMSHDLFAIPPETIRDEASCDLTLLAGQIAFDRHGQVASSAA